MEEIKQEIQPLPSIPPTTSTYPRIQSLVLYCMLLSIPVILLAYFLGMQIQKTNDEKIMKRMADHNNIVKDYTSKQIIDHAPYDIDHHISYPTPSQWLKHKIPGTLGFNDIQLTSPEYAATSSPQLQTNGTSITIRYSPYVNSGIDKDSIQTLKSIINKDYPFASHITQTTLSNSPAISFTNIIHKEQLDSNALENELNYMTQIQKNGSWKITILYGGKSKSEIENQKTKYQDVIKTFIKNFTVH